MCGTYARRNIHVDGLRNVLYCAERSTVTGTLCDTRLYLKGDFVLVYLATGNILIGFVCILRGYFGFVCVPILHVCYTSFWLKCVGIFQQILNSISVSKSTVGIHVLENLYTTTTFRLHFIV